MEIICFGEKSIGKAGAFFDEIGNCLVSAF